MATPTPSSVPFTPGSGGLTATFLITEGGDKHIQRIALCTGDGVDVGVGSFKQADFTITRPSNTTQYAINDAMAATSAEVGGSTIADASRGAGNSGVITDLLVFGSAAQGTQLDAELWLFDSAVTAVNDNAAFSLSHVDLKKMVGRIPFVLAGAGGTVSYAEAKNLNIGFTTVTNGNLRALVKVKNAYTPVSAEEITFRLKILRAD